MRIGVVINPTAGKGRGYRAGHSALAALNAAGHHVHNLSAPTYPRAAAAASAAVGAGDLDALVVVGGDGMVHLGVNAVAGSQVPLAVVAVGTGNDFARAAGLPVADPRAGVQAVLDGLECAPVRLDAGVVTQGGRSIWFAGVVSAGLDAAVNAQANRVSWPAGRARYVRAALTQIAQFRPYGYRVSVWGAPVGDEVAGVAIAHGSDGARVWQSRGTVVAVANTGQIGGGIRVAPAASLTDGLLDVVVASEFSRMGAARIFPSMYTGQHLRHPRVGVMAAQRVLIEAWGEPVPPAAFADGEQIGTAPLQAHVVAGALGVIGASASATGQ